MSEQTTAGRGVDLRTVSAGNIESMEVIRGIPSVEYGNLTSGVVVVKTKAGHTPWEAKFQTDPNSKQVFAGKGFNLKGRSCKLQRRLVAVVGRYAQALHGIRPHHGLSRILRPIRPLPLM